MYRQGDVLLVPFAGKPRSAKKLTHCVVAHGEVTGHTHRFEEGAEQLEAGGGERFIVVTGAQAALVHEEHGTLTIPKGVYRVVHQREYVPGVARSTPIPDEPELAAPRWARPAVRSMLKVAERVKELADSFSEEERARRGFLAKVNADRANRGLSPVRIHDGRLEELAPNGSWRRVED